MGIVISNKLQDTIEKSTVDKQAAKPDYSGSRIPASKLGGSCLRALWYNFRWVTPKKLPANVLRLLKTGIKAEKEFIQYLTDAGITVHHRRPDGTQYKMSGGDGHLTGYLDAVLVGTPEYGDTAVLGEFKTFNDKQFKRLTSYGVQKSHFAYFMQAQLYMGAYQLPAVYFIALNKNDSKLRIEIVEYDAKWRKWALNRVDAILGGIPERPAQSATDFICTYCPYTSVCHEEGLPVESCRTCQSAMIKDRGEWVCSATGALLSVSDQKIGCHEYLLSEQFSLQGAK